MNHYNAVISTLLKQGAYRATKFISPNTVINATRIVKGGKIDGRNRSADIYVKVGSPNYRERLFIKDALKAGESFPIRKVQIKALPVRRAA